MSMVSANVMRFRVLRGTHATGIGTTRRVYKRGEIVESTVDLAKKFGRRKFGRIHKDEPDEWPDEEQASDDTLGSMSVADLRKLAEEQEIDVSKCRTKAELINAIRGSAE